MAGNKTHCKVMQGAPSEIPSKFAPRQFISDAPQFIFRKFYARLSARTRFSHFPSVPALIDCLRNLYRMIRNAKTVTFTCIDNRSDTFTLWPCCAFHTRNHGGFSRKSLGIKNTFTKHAIRSVYNPVYESENVNSTVRKPPTISRGLPALFIFRNNGIVLLCGQGRFNSPSKNTNKSFSLLRNIYL